MTPTNAQLARVLELLDDDDEAALADEEALGVDVSALAARIRAMVAAADTRDEQRPT